jgi:formamidopyrimidine-DNA glycosylase
VCAPIPIGAFVILTMPELPELEVIRERLDAGVVGRRVKEIAAPNPIVLRCVIEDLRDAAVGKPIRAASRFGKFLMLALPGDVEIVMNLMLAGRLELCLSKQKPTKRTCLILSLEGDVDLRFRDQRLMGRIYLARGSDYAQIPKLDLAVPDALDPALTWDVFRERIRRHTGQMKGLLSNQSFVAGIGSAYSDEILFEAGVHPFRRRSSLSEEELRRVYGAVRSVLPWAIAQIRKLGRPLHEQDRSFLRVHGKPGEPCPRCRTPIAQITANQERNHFCPTCQPRGRLGAYH